MGNVRGGVVLVSLAVGVFAAGLMTSGRVLGERDRTIEDSSWSLIVGGDVMLGRSVNTRSLKYGDYRWPFLEVGEVLRQADVSMVNLENPVVAGCAALDSGMVFCSPPLSIEGLVFAGIDAVNLDNNHSMNYGSDGYAATKDLLSQNGVGWFDNQSLWQSEVKGVGVGALGFDLVSDTSPRRMERVLSRVREAEPLVQVLVVHLHWGSEYVRNPSERMREIADQLVAAGVDLIVGHHSHVVGRYEEIGEAKVIYSLGNLVFDQMWSLETRTGMLVRFEFEGTKVVSKDFLPIRIYDFGQPRLIADELEKDQVIGQFLGYSQQGSL